MTHGFYAININVVSNSNDLVLKNQIKIFPNSTSGIINIENTSASKKIKKFDWSGQLVFELKGDHQFVNLSSFKTGNYLMEKNTDLGRVVEKIVKF